MLLNNGCVLNASWAMCWLAAIIALVGCRGGSSVKASGSEDQVKQAVQQMLDAWKSGSQLSEFAASHPEIVVADSALVLSESYLRYAFAAVDGAVRDLVLRVRGGPVVREVEYLGLGACFSEVGRVAIRLPASGATQLEGNKR